MQEPAVSDFTILIDSREQAPWLFQGFHADASARGGRRPLIVQTRVVGLASGDYSIEGYQELVAIERKSLADLYGTLGQGRERFYRELQRLSGMDMALVVVESSLANALRRICDACGGGGGVCPVCNGRGTLHPVERSKLSPKSVLGSVIAWQLEFPTIHWTFADDRRLAEIVAFKWLSRWYAKRAFVVDVAGNQETA